MKNNIENGIYIPDEHRNLIPVDEWVKREDPTTAQTVVLVTDFGMLEIAKEDLPGGFNFEGAQKAAAGCILSKFYIKPQLAQVNKYADRVVSYRNSTSNHNCEAA